MRRSKMAAALGALALMAEPSVAAPPPGAPCIDRRQIENLVVFVLPTALEVAGSACASSLPRGAILSDPATAARYRAEAEAAWPDARAVVGQFGGDKGVGSLLGDDGLRSVLNDMVAKQAGKAIKPASCGTLDHLVAGLGTLPARNVAQILVAAFELSGKADRFPLRMCPASAPAPR